ncbi:predicted protein [Plenodomus lingam JN3]|uniref:Predicted protein n=1 Tax=Leptosphaeria maculans (strain JN3 / isolate v23.1.3 / race Av1-4-5-6-7-8) TaxID=985895 RepID=E4ZZ54_LEPMJ|nr:predicted protein [Plenodomus lingam JN3]CBX96649.1 predicted protein [Plenodomus lingam JN3]
MDCVFLTFSSLVIRLDSTLSSNAYGKMENPHLAMDPRQWTRHCPAFDGLPRAKLNAHVDYPSGASWHLSAKPLLAGAAEEVGACPRVHSIPLVSLQSGSSCLRAPSCPVCTPTGTYSRTVVAHGAKHVGFGLQRPFELNGGVETTGTSRVALICNVGAANQLSGLDLSSDPNTKTATTSGYKQPLMGLSCHSIAPVETSRFPSFCRACAQHKQSRQPHRAHWERRLGASDYTCIKVWLDLSPPAADIPDSAIPTPLSCLPSVHSLPRPPLRLTEHVPN